MSLERFLDAQKVNYEIALSEIKGGKKYSHWIWYIFPQINGLGYSPTSKYYAIKNKEEAIEYLKHPILSVRLLEITEELLKLDEDNISAIMGYLDDIKLKSSMTLFYLVSGNEVFKAVIDKYFDGELDTKTIAILNGNLKINK